MPQHSYDSYNNYNSFTNMEETQIPITGLEELESHLKHIIDEPDTPLNADLFDEVELQLTGMYTLSQGSARILIKSYILSTGQVIRTCGSVPPISSGNENFTQHIASLPL